jgi:hypothetical protein
MFSQERAFDIRTGSIDSIEYIWTRKSREEAVLVAVCLKYDQAGEVVGTYSAYKESHNLHIDPEQFAEENKWHSDLAYEIGEQIHNTPFGHFDLKTYISIHNTSIRTRA